MDQNNSWPLPGPHRIFFDTSTCPEQISKNFRKVEIWTSKSIFHIGQLYKRKIRVFKLPSKPNLSLSFQDFTKRCQGSEVCDQIKLSVDRIFNTSLIFQKNWFFVTLMAKILPKHAKILWKMLKKFSKNVEKIFLPNHF